MPAARPGDDDLLVVGRLGRPHGVRGELTVEVRTDDPDDRFAPGRRLYTEPADRGPLTVTASVRHSGRWLLTLDGVNDRAGAEALRDTLLLLPAADLPPLVDPEEFYDHQLVGLTARTVDDRPLGTVSDVVHGPAGDLLVLAYDGAERLVPFLAAVVPTVDVDGGYLVVDPPEGLLEL